MRQLIEKKGVTLIEITVVLAIVAVLVLLSWPEIKPNKLKGAARMIYSDLQYARMQAISKSYNVRVLFQTSNTGCGTIDNHTYVLHYDSGGSPYVASQKNNGVCNTGETLTTKDAGTDFNGVTFTANNDATFNSEGTGSSGTVTLTDSSGNSKSVVFSWTGRIRIQ